jgi:hypothetical protein
MVCDNLTFPYLEKMLKLVRPWSAYLDMNNTSQIDSLDEDQINTTLRYITQTEECMGRIYKRRNDWPKIIVNEPLLILDCMRVK